MEQATLRASPRRLREARRRGMVPVSRELLALAALVGAGGALYLGWPTLAGRALEQMQGWMALAPAAGVRPWPALTAALSSMVVTLAPALAAAVIVAVAVGLAQTRALLSLTPLWPAPSRVRPRRRAAGERAHALGAGAARAVGALLVVGLSLWHHGAALVEAAGQPVARVLAAVATCLGDLALRVGLLLLALALLDLLFQRWAHGQSLRMTRRQARQERRDAEGDAEHRAHRQRLHRELLAGQGISAVQRADCVITAPELAAALRYDGSTMAAPRVLVCRAGKAAGDILAEAHAHHRPVVHRPGLARALAMCEPGAEVPRRLWGAVAEVLRGLDKS